MRIPSRFFIVILLTLVITGCDGLGPQNEIAFKTTQTIYAAGDQVNVLLENESGSGVGLNLCFAFLSLEQQASDSKWESTGANLGPEPNSVCNADMLLLSSGQVNGGVAFLPNNQPPGLYSIVTRVEIENNNVLVRTNVFEVQ